MTDDVYRRLAQRLDATPNGFPPAPSGADQRLLARIFTTEEAALAAHMYLHRERVEAIAARAGISAAEAKKTLKVMARKGLVNIGRQDGELVVGLLPFMVGFYETQLPRMDRELAELFEAYFLEVKGGVTLWNPPVHRVIPVEESVPAGVEFYAYERASEMLTGAQAWAVRDCICRVQQKLLDKGCDRPVENCLSFGSVPGMFDGMEAMRPISLDEALRILHEAEEAGLVHSPGNFRDGNYYICNCCSCCCGILRSVAEFGLPTAIARADLLAVVDEAACAGCGDCLDRCQFGALDVTSGTCLVDAGRCVGCGLCSTTCPTSAIRLERRAEGQVSPPPASFKEWSVQRARARGLADW